MSAWQTYDLGALFPQPVADAVGVLGSASDQVGVAAETTATAVEAVAALLVDVADPLDAVVDQLVDTLRNAVGDTLKTGVYFYYDIEGWPLTPPHGLAAWTGRLNASFDDPGDANRPTFSSDAEVGAIVIVGAAASLPDLMDLLRLLGELFGLRAFTDAWRHFVTGSATQDPLDDLLRGIPMAPDWSSVTLGDALPPLRNVARLVDGAIDQLAKAGGASDLLRDLAAALRDKAANLRRLSAQLQSLIDQIAAIAAHGGLHVLAVTSTTGIAGVRQTLSSTPLPATVGGDDYVAGVCVLAGRADYEKVAGLFGL